MNRTSAPKFKIAALTMLILAGCDEHQRVARIATEAADRQAEQNREMAQLNREVAAGTSRLVTEQAKARQQALSVHQDLQKERAGLSDNWNKLEAERKDIANSRQTDSALTAIVSGGGATLAALLALALAWLVLFRGGDADEPVGPAAYAEALDVILADPPAAPQLPVNGSPGGLLTNADHESPSLQETQ